MAISTTVLNCFQDSVQTKLGSDTPIFLGLNMQAITNSAGWTTFLAQLDLAISHGINLVSVYLPDTTVSSLQTLNTQLGSRNVRIILRFYFTADSTLSDSWLATQQAAITALVQNVGIYLPNKVIGYQVEALDGGEWFLLSADTNPSLSTVNAARVSYVQTQLASTIKTATNRSALVLFNAGYLYDLAYLNGSTHANFSTILTCPDIDAIVAPYDYAYARTVGSPFLPQGPMDAPLLHNKMWITEDDTRTSLAAPGTSYLYSTSQAQDVAFMNRNVTAAINHRTGLYVFDLDNDGWYNASYLWDAIVSARNAASPAQFSTLALLNDITLANSADGTPAYGVVPLAVSNLGSGVYYGIQSDINAGLLNTSNFSIVTSLY